jgi:hypothetical protein
MEDNYQYYRFDLPGNAYGPSKETVYSLLQPIGDEAWEITYVGAERDRSQGGMLFGPHSGLQRWVDARRPPYGSPGPSTWEYTGFNINAMPEPGWSEHLASRGWQRIRGIWYSYMHDEWYVFKRTDTWRGTDDGDIRGLLESRGMNTYAALSPGHQKKSLDRIVSEILDTKWQLSVEAGYDVGTQRAVESWWSHQ